MRAGQERDEMLLRRKGKNSKRAWIEKRERERLGTYLDIIEWL